MQGLYWGCSVRKDSERLMRRAHDFFRFEMFSTLKIKQSIQQQLYAILYINQLNDEWFEGLQVSLFTLFSKYFKGKICANKDWKGRRVTMSTHQLKWFGQQMKTSDSPLISKQVQAKRDSRQYVLIPPKNRIINTFKVLLLSNNHPVLYQMLTDIIPTS